MYDDPDEEFEKMVSSRRTFDCMILFSMVPIHESISRLHLMKNPF